MEMLSEPSTTANPSIIRDFYQNHFDRYRSLSMSKTRYAKEHNLVLHRFIYWSIKFQRELEGRANPQGNHAFIPVKLTKKPPTNAVQILCTLELGDRKRLLIHDLSALPPLLELLGG